MVYLSTKDLRLKRPSRKLVEKAVGPFKVLRKEGNTYRLELPIALKDVHPVFAPEKLRAATKLPPLRGQIADPLPPIETNGEQEWEVEEILDSKLVYKRLKYKAKWLGNDDDAWYPAADFKNAPLKLYRFHAKYPEKPGPPMRLQE